MVFKSKHERISKKKDISRYLPRAFYLFGIGTDFGGDSILVLFGAIKAITSHLLNSKNKMPAVDVKIYVPSFNMRSC